MKNLFSREEFQLDELLFQNRNREYGAYNLRNESNNMLTKAMFVGVILFGAISITPLILKSLKSEVTVQPNDAGTEHIFKDVSRPDVLPPPAKVLPAQPQIATTIYDIPTPARHVVKETPATSQSNLANNAIGPETIIGVPPTNTFTPPVQIAPPVVAPPAIPKPIDNSPAKKVDVQAKFISGIEGFRSSMVQNFNTGNFEGYGDVMKTTLTFIVEKDGSISDVKASGADAEFNREAIKTIKSIRGQWTPAKLNGETVRSYFSFPISMKFE